MQKIFLLCCLVHGIFFLNAGAQNGPYNLAAVPEAVKKNASVITHLENISFEVESADKATMSVHKIFTVLNEEGREALFFNKFSTKYVSLDDAEIKVYDAGGKQTGRYKKKEMHTQSTGEGLIEDGFVTYYDLSTNSYPVTVDLKYEQKFKTTLNIPDYRFVNVKEGIVESNYTAIIPSGIDLRYKPENISLQPEISDNGKSKTYKWTVKNMAPAEYEESAVSGRSRYPHVKIATNQFSYYGMQGDLSSWKSFGTWIKNLYEGLDVLPEPRKQFFVQLVQDAPDDREKIRRVYQYLQNNFRYVSIQLGVGGLKPFSAEFTDNKKYGDCKALSNYMKAALKAIGINSYVAIINAEYNELPVDPAFPSNDFNHVILCVPRAKDSIWLECTSSTTEFGELGTFTENRNALLITEEGGALVPTPKSHSYANVLSTVTTVSVDDDFSGKSETSFNAKGVYRENINDILKEKKDRQKEAIVFYFGFRQPDVFEFVRNNTDDHKASLQMLVTKVPEFNAGGKWFIPLRMYKPWTSKLPKADNRKLDFYFHYPFEKYDTTILRLPVGIIPDVLPAERKLSCDYGSYQSASWYNEAEKSIYTSTALILRQYRIPASDYASVKKFFDDVLQDDSQKIVVKKDPAKSDTEKKAF